MSNIDKMGAIISLFISQLGKHGKDWLKMWTANGMPLRFNGKPYTGINIFILWDAIARNKYKSNTFVTWKMVMGAGGRVKEDQAKKYHTVVKVLTGEYEKKEEDSSGNEQTVLKPWRKLKFFRVYNIDQTTLEDKWAKPKSESNTARTLTHVEEYVANTKADIRFDDDFMGRCYYRPSEDFIGMVSRDQFVKTDVGATENYYSVLLHELTHWTATEKRTDRNGYKKSKYFDKYKPNELYAWEELVAELGSAIQSCLLGIIMEPAKHSLQYFDIWKDRIKNDPESIIKACSQASKAVQYIDTLQPKEKQMFQHEFPKKEVEKKKDIAA